MKRSISGIVVIIVCLFLTSSLGAQEGGRPNTLRPKRVREWHAMGTWPCAWWAPLNQPNGQIDIDGTVHGLRSNGFQCGVFVIEGAGQGNSYDSFQNLLETTKNTNIKLWVVIIPPSEGADSLPYRSDYVEWSQALAKLSLKYKNFRGFNIDDIDQDVSVHTFTRSYLREIYAAKQKINPRFLFVPTIYDLDRTVADRLAGCVDGVWLWRVNLDKSTGLPSFLENSRFAVEGRFPIYGGVYAQLTSWHKEGNPQAEVFQQSLEASCKYSDGAVIWQLTLTPANPLLSVTKT
ncbi:MAG: hypothetical protein ACREQ5_29055, partial [Candidatus Dormibacteria bacterium]